MGAPSPGPYALARLGGAGNLSAAASPWPSALASPAAAAGLGGRAGSSYGSLSAPLFGAGSVGGPLSGVSPCWDAGAVGSPSNPLGAVGSPPPCLHERAEGPTSQGLFLPGLQSLGYSPAAPSPFEQLHGLPQASPWAGSAVALSPLGGLFPAAAAAGRAGSPHSAPPNPLIHELLQALSQQQQHHHHHQGGVAAESLEAGAQSASGGGGRGGGPRTQLGCD
jgi:hypothetical protein